MTRLALSIVLALVAAVAVAEEPPQPGFGKRMVRFGGGIALGEYAHVLAAGDAIGADLAKTAPLTPEFMTSLLMFDASMQLGDRALKRVAPGGGKVGGVLKHNLALAGAMTLAQAVQVDFGGFEYTDALGGDFSDLANARVRLGDVDAQSLGITLGVFAAWGPAYTGLKTGAKKLASRAARRVGLGAMLEVFGKAVAKRFLVSAASKAALTAAPVPGSRVVALGWAALDVALAIGDTAILLQTAHLIEAPIQAANDRRKARAAVRGKAAAAEGLARAGSPEELAQALAETGAAFDGYRNLAYLDVAQADQRLFQWLRQRGYPQDELDALANQAYREYGTALALPALSAMLQETLQRRLDAARRGEGEPLAISADELERGLNAHRRRVGELLVAAQEELQGALKTERAFLDGLRTVVAQDPARRAAVQEAIERVETNAAVTPWLLDSLAQPGASPEAADTTPEPASGLGIDDIVGDIGGA
jgi:hypothetical protein